MSETPNREKQLNIVQELEVKLGLELVNFDKILGNIHGMNQDLIASIAKVGLLRMFDANDMPSPIVLDEEGLARVFTLMQVEIARCVEEMKEQEANASEGAEEAPARSIYDTSTDEEIPVPPIPEEELTNLN